MGNERDARTVELDREQLKKLLADGDGDAASASEPPADGAVAVAAEPEPSTARTATLHDPMTMALLAEVARDSRTIEMDPRTIADAIEAAGATEPPAESPADPGDLAHPHLKRRG